tara:strand:+ start:855 stop:1127 length:273 start_codon:yes stop_codon:yes gene_type:complete
MNLADYLQFLEPLTDQLNRVYSIVSLALTILIVLWLFNFFIGLIQRTYSIGKVFGKLYRNYFHRYFRGLFINLFSFAYKNQENSNILTDK